MSDFVLVNPPLSARARYGSLASVGNRLPNLGLAYLAAFLRDQGIETAIVDAAAMNYSVDQTAAAVQELAPRVCGVTASTLAVDVAGQIAAAVKERLPACAMIVGGAHVTSRPEQTLAEYPGFDFGVMGEAELTAVDLFDAITGGGSAASIAGVVYREDGLIRRTGPRDLIDDLDELPLPAWDLLPDLAATYAPSPQSIYRLPSTILFTARGCPYGCTFCDRSVFGRSLRLHSAKRVWEMMEHLYRHYGIIDFAFHDESLLIHEGRLVELCRYIQRSGLPISFSGQGRVDQKLSSFALRELAKAGCWQMSFGLESGSDEILRILGKGTTVARAHEALATMREAGIATKAFIMLGCPGETKETLQETRELVLSAPIDDVMIGFFTPFPGIELLKGIDWRGEIIGTFAEMSEHRVTFVPNGLTAKSLRRFRRRLYRRFYLRPGVIRQYLRRLREPSGRRVLLRAAFGFLWSALFGR
ncbi:MAG: radical SAM protein [Candidatus Lernaella stagnicola]|nr:radical SAM protein [Candidatus Lernaella stagnicola]